MRLTEIFEDNNPSKVIGFDMAWHNKKDAIPQKYHSKVRTLARNQLSKDETPSAAINNAWILLQLQLQKQDLGKKTPNNQPQSVKTTDPKPTVKRVRPTLTKGDSDRVGKTGKRWGNQYYSNPASGEVGIKGAMAKNRPGAIAKREVEKIKQAATAAIDIQNLPGNLKKLNPKNRRK